MDQGFHIEHQCPQCGAPAVLDEMDRLFSCDFCRVRSYLISDDVFRYILPHKARGKEIFYYPFWRFRGVLYSCLRKELTQRLIDTSFQAVSSRYFPVSLGLRTQAMNLRFATNDIQSRFIVPELAVEDALSQLAEINSGSNPNQVVFQEFIGESLSVIYSPFYIEDGLIDAVTNKPVANQPPPEFFSQLPSMESPHWPVNFVPAMCPNCGWDLAGERDSLVLSCGNCHSVWKSLNGALVSLPFGCLPGKEKPTQYIPYWRITADVQGVELESFADLVEAANLPKVVQPGWENRQFHFWSPAFKIRPQMFIRLSRNMTLAQPEAEPESVIPTAPVYPVTLPLSEALESIHVLLAHILNPPIRWYPRIPDIQITPRATQLVLVPFQQQGSELINSEYRLAVSCNALKYAMTM
jgi:ribosomal protein S27AE